MAIFPFYALLISLFAPLTWSASMRLPSYPLAVKTPYLSAWLPGYLSSDFPSATPLFWWGQSLNWTVMARVHDKTYCLLGCPGGRPGVIQATQKSLNFTSTHTYVTLEAGSTELTMDFFSPVDPVDHVRQSLPFSYLTVNAKDKHGKATDVGLLNAIDTSWIPSRGSPYVDFASVNGTQILMLDGEDGAEFSEDHNMARWGKVVLASKAANKHSNAVCRVGTSEAVFASFVENGVLPRSEEKMDYGSLAVCSHRISTSTHSGATFAIGVYQDNEMQYFTGKKIDYYAGYFRSKVSNVTEAVDYFLDDYEDALAESYRFDQEIIDIGKVTSSNYSDLLEASMRQSFAGQQVMIPAKTLDTSHPYSFIKEISTDGNVNTLADLIPKSLPIFHVLNPEYTRMMLEPVLRFSKNAWPLNHAVHDIGKRYPNATGETPCIEEFLPLDSTSVLLWMLYLYQDSTGDTELTETYDGILRRYADYCYRYGLYPVLQRSSVDALGSATNQSALSVSAAIALNAYGKMTGLSNYSDAGVDFAEKIVKLASDSKKTHLLTHYTDGDEAWVLMYPLAFDAWLRLGTFSSKVYEMQSQWYSQHIQPFGIQYRHNIRYTLMEWTMWIAAVSPRALRDQLINGVHRFLDQKTGPEESFPGPSQWIVAPGKDEGLWTHFSKAKSVIGSIFMVAAVQGGFDEDLFKPRGPRLHNSLLPKSGSNNLVLQGPCTEQTVIESGAPVSAVDLGIPLDLPAGASKPVNPSFVGLSFDIADVPKYMGNSSAPNTESIRLIRNLVETTGTLITLRVGGPEADYVYYNESQDGPIRRLHDSKLSVGPAFFDSIKTLGEIKRSNWIYQVPFAPFDRINAIKGASKAMDAITPDKLIAFEVGYQANRYAGVARPASYGCQKYAEEFFKFKVALRAGTTGALGNKFQALGLSHWHIDDRWTAEECFTAGIESIEDLRSLSAHFSHFNTSEALRKPGLFRHSAIVQEYKEVLPQVDYVNKIYPCHPFFISEASLISPSEFDPREGRKKPTDATELGITLWNLDFLLYSMANNVSKVLMHQSCYSVSSAWTPGSCDASSLAETRVNGPYAALTFVASFLRGARDFRVFPVQQSDDTVVYAGYESGKLSKIAIVSYPAKDEVNHDARVGTRKLDLPVPAIISSFRQTRRVSLADLDRQGAASGSSTWIGGDSVQIPMSDEPQTVFEFKHGLLSIDLSEGMALLLEV